MVIFALDSSGATASVAITRDDEVVGALFSDSGLTHSQRLMPLCAELFSQTRLSPADIDAFAVTGGPGSFTGLRIGISTIKGLCFPYDARCISISTTEALAAGCQAQDETVVPVMDARADRVYVAAFTSGERLLEDSAQKIDALADILKDVKKPVVFVGDAALMCYNRLNKILPCRASGQNAVRAEVVARIARERLQRGEGVSCEALTPDYLQLPQAQRKLLEDMGK